MPTTQQLQERVAELIGKRVKLAETHHRLQTDLADELNDMRLGQEGAEARAAAIKPRIAEAEKSLQAAAGEAARAEETLTRQQRAEERAADLARQLSIPHLAKRCRDGAHIIDTLAAELGAAMNAHAECCTELAIAVGSTEARRVLGVSALAERYRYCLARHFEHQEQRNAADLAIRGPATVLRWLPWPLNPGSPEFRMTLASKLHAILDDFVRVFASEREALEARERIQPTERLFVIPGLDGVFHLEAGRLRGAAAKKAKGDEA